VIGLPFVYAVAGLVFAAYALLSLVDRAHPKRFGHAAFWGLVATSFLAGGRLGDVGNGVLVLGLAGVAGLGGLGRKPEAARADVKRQAMADRFGGRLFWPAILLPVLVVIGVVALRPTTLAGAPILDPKQATIASLTLAAIVATLFATAFLRQPLCSPLQEGRRLADALGWAGLLPQMLAALGAVFALAGVGRTIGGFAAAWLPADDLFAAVAAYGIGMALLTMAMGNAFAAFPVMSAALGVPLLVHRFGGDPATVSAIGMLCGFCGTLMTPLAANFNLVPPALLDLDDRYAVIKAQIPTALILLVINLGLIYVLAFR
jgi:uncharacterized membrane protein